MSLCHSKTLFGVYVQSLVVSWVFFSFCNQCLKLDAALRSDIIHAGVLGNI